MTALGGWENFYVIVGSAAGALIGLQFVVVTLAADRPHYVRRRLVPFRGTRSDPSQLFGV
jgi:hypothetical protein